MTEMNDEKLLTEDRVRAHVRATYGAIARAAPSPAPSCCGPGPALSSALLGYSGADLAALPEGANLGLGCGNPNAIAALSEGETVLDLGSGAGIDCFLAAKRVGALGRVIGVDMTPDMIAKARSNAARVSAAICLPSITFAPTPTTYRRGAQM